MKPRAKRQITGWIAAALSIAVTCVWAFWGIIETFHEGWHHDSLLLNVAMMLVQYLSPMLLFLGVTVVAIRWPRTGSLFHLVLAAGVAWFFRSASSAAITFLTLPLLGINALHWYGRPVPEALHWLWPSGCLCSLLLPSESSRPVESPSEWMMVISELGSGMSRRLLKLALRQPPMLSLSILR